MKVAIIGGGASGLMCASFLKRNNSKLDITIYEKNKGLGRKILASGNGKCNFMNYKATIFDYNNPDFVKNIFNNTSKNTQKIKSCKNFYWPSLEQNSLSDKERTSVQKFSRL